MVVIALIALIRAIHAFLHQRQGRATRETGLPGRPVVRRGQGAPLSPRGSHATTDNSVDVPALTSADAQQVRLSVALMDQPETETETSGRTGQPTHQEEESWTRRRSTRCPPKAPADAPRKTSKAHTGPAHSRA